MGQHGNLEQCGPWPKFAGFTLAFALQLRKKHGKNLSQSSRRVPVVTMNMEYTERTYITIRIHKLQYYIMYGRVQLKCDGKRVENRFRVSGETDESI